MNGNCLPLPLERRLGAFAHLFEADAGRKFGNAQLVLLLVDIEDTEIRDDPINTGHPGQRQRAALQEFRRT